MKIRRRRIIVETLDQNFYGEKYYGYEDAADFINHEFWENMDYNKKRYLMSIDRKGWIDEYIKLLEKK